jgi:hypothetical protein
MDVSVRLGDVVDWLRHIDRLARSPARRSGCRNATRLGCRYAALRTFGGDRA